MKTADSSSIRLASIFKVSRISFIIDNSPNPVH
jgi:hypothetical protein